MIVVASPAPWFVYMWLRFRDAFVAGYLLDENISLFATNRFNTRLDPAFYFRVLAAGLLPWTGLVIGRLVDDVRGVIRTSATRSGERMLWCWIIAIVGFFSRHGSSSITTSFPRHRPSVSCARRAWADVRERMLASPERRARASDSTPSDRS